MRPENYMNLLVASCWCSTQDSAELQCVLTFLFFKNENRLFFFLESNVLSKTRSIFNSLIFFQNEFAYEGQIYIYIYILSVSYVIHLGYLVCLCVCVCVYFFQEVVYNN